MTLEPTEDDEMVARVEDWLAAHPSGGGIAAARSALSDCAEFLADIDGELARRCEDALAAMRSSTPQEPTQWGDDTAAKMRAYFEEHKRDRWQEGTADNLMLGLLNIAVTEYATSQEPDDDALLAKIAAIRNDVDAFNPDMRVAARSGFDAQEKLWKLLPEITARLQAKAPETGEE